MQYYIIVIETAHSTNIWYLPPHEVVESQFSLWIMGLRREKNRKMTNGVVAFQRKPSQNVGKICFDAKRKILDTSVSLQVPTKHEEFIIFQAWDIY